LGGVILGLWYAPVAAAFRDRRRQWLPYLIAALGSVGVAIAALAALGGEGRPTELPFPAEALRIAHEPPAISLTNQEGTPFSLRDADGQVVLLTAIYASCPRSCPLIMGQVKRALGSLAPELQRDVRVVLVSMNPEQDTPSVLWKLADVYQVKAPAYEFLTGDPPAVNRILDALEVARTRDPRTGIIDHSNLCVLIDRKGKVAYRFSLGSQQERWLTSALAVLTREVPPASLVGLLRER
jgi:protein SCO1/2